MTLLSFLACLVNDEPAIYGWSNQPMHQSVSINMAACRLGHPKSTSPECPNGLVQRADGLVSELTSKDGDKHF